MSEKNSRADGCYFIIITKNLKWMLKTVRQFHDSSLMCLPFHCPEWQFYISFLQGLPVPFYISSSWWAYLVFLTSRNSLIFLPLTPHLLLSLCLSSRSSLFIPECHTPALCKGQPHLCSGPHHLKLPKDFVTVMITPSFLNLRFPPHYFIF